MEGADELLEQTWIDVLGFTKTDWEEVELIAASLIANGYFKSDSFKCTVAATALFVTDGRGVKESTQ